MISHILFGSGYFGVDFETLDYCVAVAVAVAVAVEGVSPEGGSYI